MKHGAGFQLWDKLRQWAKHVKSIDRGDLEELFQMVDTDKSGSISEEEFGQLTNSLGLQLGLVEVGDAFREIDVDHSGAIEFEEFLQFCIQTQTRTTAGGSVRKKLKHWLKAVREIDNNTMKEMFDELDVDNDGVITRLEFQQLLDSIGFQLKPAELAASFAAIDKDGNGTVDYDEFRAFYESKLMDNDMGAHLKTALKTWAKQVRNFDAEHLKQIFAQVDANGSGALDRMEFGELCRLMNGLDLSKSDLDEAFREIDTDGGGTIQLDELTAFFDESTNLKSKAGRELQGKMKDWAKHARSLDSDLLQDMFSEVDKDGSRAIDKSEFGLLTSKLGLQLTDQELTHAFNDIDVDGSGEIDFNVRFHSWLFVCLLRH